MSEGHHSDHHPNDDLVQCAACLDHFEDLDRCSDCGALYCPDCWDEHHAQCAAEPDPLGRLDADEDHCRESAA